MGINRLRQKNFLDTIPSFAACCNGQEKIANLFCPLILFKPDLQGYYLIGSHYDTKNSFVNKIKKTVFNFCLEDNFPFPVVSFSWIFIRIRGLACLSVSQTGILIFALILFPLFLGISLDTIARRKTLPPPKD